MVTTATGRPPLSLTAWRSTSRGMATPTVAMRTAADWVGCWSNLAFRKGNPADRRIGSCTAPPAWVPTAASAGIGGIAGDAAYAGGLSVVGVHVGRVQDVRLLDAVEVH